MTRHRREFQLVPEWESALDILCRIISQVNYTISLSIRESRWRTISHTLKWLAIVQLFHGHSSRSRRAGNFHVSRNGSLWQEFSEKVKWTTHGANFRLGKVNLKEQRISIYRDESGNVDIFTKPERIWRNKHVGAKMRKPLAIKISTKNKLLHITKNFNGQQESQRISRCNTCRAIHSESIMTKFQALRKESHTLRFRNGWMIHICEEFH